jgi:hypothetical protein
LPKLPGDGGGVCVSRVRCVSKLSRSKAKNRCGRHGTGIQLHRGDAASKFNTKAQSDFAQTQTISIEGRMLNTCCSLKAGRFEGLGENASGSPALAWPIHYNLQRLFACVANGCFSVISLVVLLSNMSSYRMPLAALYPTLFWWKWLS